MGGLAQLIGTSISVIYYLGNKNLTMLKFNNIVCFYVAPIMQLLAAVMFMSFSKFCCGSC